MAVHTWLFKKLDDLEELKQLIREDLESSITSLRTYKKVNHNRWAISQANYREAVKETYPEEYVEDNFKVQDPLYPDGPKVFLEDLTIESFVASQIEYLSRKLDLLKKSTVPEILEVLKENDNLYSDNTVPIRINGDTIYMIERDPDKGCLDTFGCTENAGENDMFTDPESLIKFFKEEDKETIYLDEEKNEGVPGCNEEKIRELFKNSKPGEILVSFIEII